jgi:hypothetical protein
MTIAGSLVTIALGTILKYAVTAGWRVRSE